MWQGEQNKKSVRMIRVAVDMATLSRRAATGLWQTSSCGVYGQSVDGVKLWDEVESLVAFEFDAARLLFFPPPSPTRCIAMAFLRAM